MFYLDLSGLLQNSGKINNQVAFDWWCWNEMFVFFEKDDKIEAKEHRQWLLSDGFFISRTSSFIDNGPSHGWFTDKTDRLPNAADKVWIGRIWGATLQVHSPLENRGTPDRYVSWQNEWQTLSCWGTVKSTADNNSWHHQSSFAGTRCGRGGFLYWIFQQSHKLSPRRRETTERPNMVIQHPTTFFRGQVI